MNTLNPKQEAFCREYVVDWNGTQAAIRAGYAPGSAEVQASRLLSDDKVKKFVADLAEQAIERNEISATWVIGQLWKVSLTAKSDGARVRALELLGKYHALFIDRQRIDSDLEQMWDEEIAQKGAKILGVSVEQVRAKMGLPTQGDTMHLQIERFRIGKRQRRAAAICPRGWRLPGNIFEVNLYRRIEESAFPPQRLARTA